MGERMGDAHVEKRQDVVSTGEVEHLGLYTIFNVQPPEG